MGNVDRMLTAEERKATATQRRYHRKVQAMWRIAAPNNPKLLWHRIDQIYGEDGVRKIGARPGDRVVVVLSDSETPGRVVRRFKDFFGSICLVVATDDGQTFDHVPLVMVKPA